MSDLDEQTIQWLGSLKMGNRLNYVSDFQNGYHMGVIFERINLAKGRKFKNTNDMACKFQNYKNIRDLLFQNFKVDFPIQNILFNTEALLMTIRDAVKRYNRDKKEATLQRIQTYSVSKVQPGEQKMFSSRRNDILSSSKLNQTSKFPKKIQQIEQKLEKYRQIKTQHEVMALQDRRREIEQNRRIVEEHRVFELNKVRANHEFTKEHERKVFEVWMKTEQIKKTRQEKDNSLKMFLNEKKNKFHQSLRDEEVNGLKEGLDAFQMNCIRQGIQLEHDPDKPLRKTEDNFNKQVVLQRIKDNIKIHDQERKDRIKRENKKRVDAQQANIKAQQIWKQNNLVQDYARKMTEHSTYCKAVAKTLNRQAAERQIIKQKARNKSYTELPPSTVDEELRAQEYRIRQMQYRDEKIVRLQRRQKKHTIIAENALEALIDIVISNEDNYYTNNGFVYSEWKQVENDFLSSEKKEKKLKGSIRYIDNSYEGIAKEYISQVGEWTQDSSDKIDFKVSHLLSDIVEKTFPPLEVPQKSQVPLYMPLKIGFVGNRLSGKTLITNKIASKYGVILINPKSILTQAFELNKQPVAQDPKKKKDLKKPEEQNPQKVALKQFGQKMMKKIDSPQNATVEHYIEVIQFSLKRNYENKNEEGILQQFQESKVKQTERYSKALKEFQEVQKKGKKDSKKPEGDQPPTEKKYYYTKGFAIEGLQLTVETLKQIELKLNGHISFEQRINKKGEEMKEKISNIIPISQAVKDTSLHRGAFDLLIYLDSKLEILEERQSSQKIDLKDNDFADIKNYYSEFGDQKCNMKAFSVIANNGTIDECVDEVYKLIDNHLDRKYAEIQTFKMIKVEQKPEVKEEEKTEIKQENKEGEEKKQQQTVQKLAVEQEVKQDQTCQQQVSKEPQLSQQASQKLLNKFNSIFSKYLKNIIQAFTDHDQLRNQFGVNLMAVEQQFVSIINRPDDKAGKILTFQDNYNKLLNQRTNIVKDAEASKHLINKLDELNDNIWTLIEHKKNEAVAQREKVLASSILNSEIEKIVEVTKNLFQNQLTLLVEIIFFIYNINNAFNGSNEDIPTQYMVLGIPPNMEPILSFDGKDFVSNRLNYYTKQTKACIADLPIWLKKKQKKFKILKSKLIENVLQDFIEKQVKKINERLDQIRDKAKQLYLEYYCFFTTLTNKMDDWIIQGIKHENEFIYDIYKSMKKNILEAKKLGVKDLFVKDITDILHPISSLPPKRLPIVINTTQNQLQILSFTIFMQEIKCLATGGRIPFKVFKSYIQKRQKSKWLVDQFLRLELDIMQQYLVTDDFCNYREVALAMLLWKIKTLDEDGINQYQKSLAGSLEVSGSENFQYVKEELSFEEFKLFQGLNSGREEERILNAFVFQIFREEYRDKIVVKDYIDTLRLFNQLQVFKYGDTLMILHQAGDSKHYEDKK